MRIILSILVWVVAGFPVLADMNISGEPLTFEITDGNGTVLPEITFDNGIENSVESAQATCAMTPGSGNQVPPILDLSPLPINEEVVLTGYNAAERLEPLSSLRVPPNYPNNRPYRPNTPIIPNEDTEDSLEEGPEIALTPEPTTLGVMLVGLLGLAFYTRRKGRK